jgi:hypothetical protein
MGGTTMEKKIKWLMTLAIMLFIINTVYSCKTTQYVPVKEIRTDTLRKSRKDSIKWIEKIHFTDSIRWRDSVATKVDAQGNIIGKDTWHWREKTSSVKDSTWYYKSRLDSVLHSKTDSVPKPYPVYKDKYIDKKLSWWQTLALDMGYVVIGAVLLAIVYFIVKLWKKFNVTNIIKKLL